MKHLYLMGMPGSGKTYWMEALTGASGVEGLDLDKEIEAMAGMAISEIFARYGEELFRKQEHAALAAIAARKGPLIVALGGGTPTFEENFDLIRKSGISVFLDVGLETLIKRVQGQRGRPLLDSGDSEEMRDKLTSLYHARMPSYEKADFKIKETELDLSRLMQILSDMD